MAAKHPKSFISLADADHLLSRKSDAAYVGNVIAAWADRYLDRIGPIQFSPESVKTGDAGGAVGAA